MVKKSSRLVENNIVKAALLKSTFLKTSQFISFMDTKKMC